MSDLLIMRGSKGWSALYVDGVLEHVSDHDVVDEMAIKMAGVEFVYSDDFLFGGDTIEDAAKTLGEVEAYRAAKFARERNAKELLRQADALKREYDTQDLMFIRNVLNQILGTKRENEDD